MTERIEHDTVLGVPLSAEGVSTVTTTDDRPDALLRGGNRFLVIPVALVGLVAVLLVLSLVFLVFPSGPSTMGERVAARETGSRLFVVATLLGLQLALLRTRRVDRFGAAAIVAAAVAAAALFV